MPVTNFDAIQARGKHPIQQRMIDLAVQSTVNVLAATLLAEDVPTEVTEGITPPTHYRTLRIQGNNAAITGAVVIHGTDWAGKEQTERIATNGGSAVGGDKPFATVTKIVLPPRGAVGNAISVGMDNKIGLYRPIAAAGDLLQVARKAGAATSYTTEATGTVDVANGTVLQGGAVVAGDSFEIAYLANEI